MNSVLDVVDGVIVVVENADAAGIGVLGENAPGVGGMGG